MFKVSTTEPKMSSGKRTIRVTNCTIDNGVLKDDEGEVLNKIKEVVGSDEFTISITLPLEGSEDV